MSTFAEGLGRLLPKVLAQDNPETIDKEEWPSLDDNSTAEDFRTRSGEGESPYVVLTEDVDLAPVGSNCVVGSAYSRSLRKTSDGVAQELTRRSPSNNLPAVEPETSSAHLGLVRTTDTSAVAVEKVDVWGESPPWQGHGRRSMYGGRHNSNSRAARGRVDEGQARSGAAPRVDAWDRLRSVVGQERSQRICRSFFHSGKWDRGMCGPARGTQ